MKLANFTQMITGYSIDKIEIQVCDALGDTAKAAIWVHVDGETIFRASNLSTVSFKDERLEAQRKTKVVKDRAYYEKLRRDLKRIRSELEASPDEYRHAYSLCVGSILNAYREGDVTFDEECAELRMKNDAEIDAKALREFVATVQKAANHLRPS